jgi:hypothetical protein
MQLAPSCRRLVPPDYALFEGATMQVYQPALPAANPSGETKVDLPAVRQAFIGLQDEAPVWRAARSVHALEEVALAELMQRRGLSAGVP